MIGVIGGSGLYQMEGLSNVREQRIATPFGEPSDAFILGELDGVPMAFLPRHGRGHRFNPTEVNYRANIWGMKKLGVDWIISVSAVGSLQLEVEPGHMVLIDQFIDRTKGVRKVTFFEDGIVAHVSFGDPVCGTLRRFILQSSIESGAVTHDGGTYVCMEGPQFSTRAESNLYRSWGARVIGMTNLTEAKLAREAEISYATLAMSTDYDCWHQDHGDVTVDEVIATMSANVDVAKDIIRRTVPRIVAHAGPAPAKGCMRNACMTSRDAIPAATLEKVSLLVGEYL